MVNVSMSETKSSITPRRVILLTLIGLACMTLLKRDQPQQQGKKNKAKAVQDRSI